MSQEKVDCPSDFRERANRVFGCLPPGPEVSLHHQRSVVDDDKEAVPPVADIPRPTPPGSHYVGKVKYKGRQHQVHFKAPRASFSARYTPDYVKHPEKWKKYDLKEDGTDKLGDMSADQVNRNAALEFLKERRGLVEDERTSDSSDNSVTFRKPKGFQSDPDGTAKSIHVMQEYHFGTKKCHRKKTVTSTFEHASSHSVNLSHLVDDESSD